MNAALRILVSRTDNLGDVMMALPALDCLRQGLPEAEIEVACKPAFRALVGPFLRARRLGWTGLPGGFRARARFLAERRYAAMLCLNQDPTLLAAGWWAHVPTRVGVYSRLPSFLFLNHGVRQARSSAAKNEGRYSLELAQHLVRRLTGTRIAAGEAGLTIEGDAESREQARDALRAAGIQEGDRFMILHPGTSGTALNLSGEQYAEVAAALEATYGLPLLLSQGPSPIDEALIAVIRERFRPVAVIRHPDLAVVREIYRRAELVVAPSTGPLHMAHYVGTRTIGFYDPTRSHRISRWGVWGGSGPAESHAPPVNCPGTRSCVGPRCPEFFCMARFDWPGLIRGSRGPAERPVVANPDRPVPTG